MTLVHSFLEKIIVLIVGMVLPIIALVLPRYREAISVLADNYKKETGNLDQQIRTQIQAQSANENVDYDVIQRNIKDLKKLRSVAKWKQKILDAQVIAKSLGWLALIMASSYLVYLLNVESPSPLKFVPLILSLVALVMFLAFFSTVTSLLFEVESLRKSGQESSVNKTNELLTKILVAQENNSPQTVVPKNWVVGINCLLAGYELKESPATIKLDHNVKLSKNISVRNDSAVMAKQIEIGFDFPNDFLIHKSEKYVIWSREGFQIPRFQTQQVHAGNHLILGQLEITPLKKGVFEVDAYIAGENFEIKKGKFRFEVVEPGS